MKTQQVEMKCRKNVVKVKSKHLFAFSTMSASARTMKKILRRLAVRVDFE